MTASASAAGNNLQFDAQVGPFALKVQAVQFDFDIGKDDTVTAQEIAFDLGIPALGVEARFKPQINFGFDLHFGFGVSSQHGFYFVTDHGGNAAPEMKVDVDVNLSGLTNFDLARLDPSAPSGQPATATGRLLFLALRLRDGVDIDGNHVLEARDLNGDGVISPSEREFSTVYLHADVNIQDPNHDGKLTGSVTRFRIDRRTWR